MNTDTPVAASPLAAAIEAAAQAVLAPSQEPRP